MKPIHFRLLRADMEQGETVRLFTAFTIPEQLRNQIVKLPKSQLDFKTISHADDLHITLRFIGDVPVAKLEDIRSCLETMKKPAEFTLEVAGLGIFAKKEQTALYAPVVSVRKLSLLADQITARLAQVDLSYPARDYIPHITIARLRSPRNFESYQKKNAGTIRAQWKAHAFHLMQSANTGNGEKRYTVLDTYSLSPY